MDFLRDVGKYFTVNWMLAKDSVKRRLEGEDGISFTEFSYMLLQAYDFLVLYDRHGCTLQMGGSDQWGNIVAGVELIRRLRQGRAYGLVCPLVTTASGVKFGKTEAGAVWLDAGLTSPFAFYQFWIQTDDRDVVRYLKFFTWLGREEIAALERATAEAPERREAQRRLAEEVTRAVHGDGELAKAEQRVARCSSARRSATSPSPRSRRSSATCRRASCHGRRWPARGCRSSTSSPRPDSPRRRARPGGRSRAAAISSTTGG